MYRAPPGRGGGSSRLGPRAPWARSISSSSASRSAGGLLTLGPRGSPKRSSVTRGPAPRAVGGRRARPPQGARGRAAGADRGRAGVNGPCCSAPHQRGRASNDHHAEQRHTVRSTTVDDAEVAQHADVRGDEGREAGDSGTCPRPALPSRWTRRCARAPAPGPRPSCAPLCSGPTASTLNSVEIAITSAPSAADIGLSGIAQQKTARAPTSRFANAIGISGTAASRGRRRMSSSARKTATRPASSVNARAARGGQVAVGLGRQHRQADHVWRSRRAGGLSLLRMSSITCF